MKNDFKKDLKKANDLFFMNKEYFIEELKCKEIYSVEDNENEVFKLLDIKAGIDFIIEDDMGLKTVANRVQQCDFSFNSFTIRYSRKNGSKTEYEKRIHSIKNNYTYPDLTIQSYMSKVDNRVFNYFSIETKLLYEYVENNIEMILKRTTYDGNEFLVIPFKDLEEWIEYQN